MSAQSLMATIKDDCGDRSMRHRFYLPRWGQAGPTAWVAWPAACLPARRSLAACLLRGCCCGTLQTRSTCRPPRRQLLVALVLLQRCHTSLELTPCGQSDAALVDRVASVREAVFHTVGDEEASRFEGIRMTWPSQRSCLCSIRSSIDSMLSVSVNAFVTSILLFSTSGCD